MNFEEPSANVADQKKKILAKIAQADVSSSSSSSDSEIQLAGNKVQDAYDTACNDYSDTEVDRTNNLNNFSKIITRLLKKGNVAVGTQTLPVDGMNTISEMKNADFSVEGDQNSFIQVNNLDEEEGDKVSNRGASKQNNSLLGGGPPSSSRLQRPVPNANYLHG